MSVRSITDDQMSIKASLRTFATPPGKIRKPTVQTTTKTIHVQWIKPLGNVDYYLVNILSMIPLPSYL